METSVYSSDYSKVEYNGYGYQQTDLGHPGYGGYSTAGPFPLTSPLSRPRSSKAKSQSGELDILKYCAEYCEILCNDPCSSL